MTNLKIYDDKKWSELSVKEKSQLIVAFSFGAASIILGFVSFILLLYIPGSVITMSGLWASVTCTVLGIAQYFKTEMAEFRTKINEEIQKINENQQNS